MKIAVSGLGRMGGQIAKKLIEDGHDLAVNNRSPAPIDELARIGAKPTYTKQEVIDFFDGRPATIWIMLPNEVVERELMAWLDILPRRSLLIDGGNSNFKITQKHSRLVASHGSTLLDVGTSGGVWGYKNGFSMMVGGREDDFKKIEPALKTLANPAGAYDFFGDSGSGHFVKMVHNAVEYGMMESLAEGYRMLKEGGYDIDLAKAGEVWQHGSVIVSWLNELCRDILRENPNLKGVEGKVSELGEARWTLEHAAKIKLPMPGIQAALDVRHASQNGEINFSTKLLAAMRNKFGGHQINPE